MRKIYYVREGTGDGQTSQGSEFSADELSQKLKGQNIKFLGTNPPTFKPEKKVNPYADYQYVVIEVDYSDMGKDASPSFNRKGFYLVENLTPKGFSQLK